MLISTTCGFFHPDDISGLLNAWQNSRITIEELLNERTAQQHISWNVQREHGIHHIPSNDVVLTDPVYNTAGLLGIGEKDPGRRLVDYYKKSLPKRKWYQMDIDFATPVMTSGQTFQVSETEVIEDFEKAKSEGLITRPVLVGPITFMDFSSISEGSENALGMWSALLPAYRRVIEILIEKGAEWIQFDEPCFTRPQKRDVTKLAEVFYTELLKGLDVKTCLTTYSGGLGDNLRRVMMLPVTAVHFDLISEPEQYTQVLDNDWGKVLSLGILDGHNSDVTPLSAQLRLVERSVNQVGLRRTMVGPSCPFYCYQGEEGQSNETRRDKLKLLSTMAKAMNVGKAYIQKEVEENQNRLSRLQKT